MFTNCLKKMDAQSFLGLDVWEFSYRSLRSSYGKWFLQAILLRHPWQTLVGLLKYAFCIRRARTAESALVDVSSESEFVEDASMGDWLVAMGFCQKPIDPPCPVGRFNHQCLLLQRNQLNTPPEVCRDCAIRKMALRALPAGAAIYIMTSAMDIAHHMLEPGLKHQPWRGVMLAICPFSFPPFSIAMSICRLRGLLFPYHSGDCRDFQSWLRADEGEKPEQTFLTDSSTSRMIKLVDGVVRCRMEKKRPILTQFREINHIYVPGEQA